MHIYIVCVCAYAVSVYLYYMFLSQDQHTHTHYNGPVDTFKLSVLFSAFRLDRYFIYPMGHVSSSFITYKHKDIKDAI